MKEILIISGFIMLVFSFRSFAEWKHSRKNENSSTQKNHDLYEE